METEKFGESDFFLHGRMIVEILIVASDILSTELYCHPPI